MLGELTLCNANLLGGKVDTVLKIATFKSPKKGYHCHQMIVQQLLLDSSVELFAVVGVG